MPTPSYQRGCPSRSPSSMPSERTGQRPFCGMMRVYWRSVGLFQAPSVEHDAPRVEHEILLDAQAGVPGDVLLGVFPAATAAVDLEHEVEPPPLG
jgi:hypothetical protein